MVETKSVGGLNYSLLEMGWDLYLQRLSHKSTEKRSKNGEDQNSFLKNVFEIKYFQKSQQT